MTTGVSDRTRLPALDGLRGVAILLVLVGHTTGTIPLTDGFGATGVSIFFALSGYLITSLLLQEAAKTGRISLPAFYARRARRLFPALAVFLAVVLALALTVAPGLGNPRDLIPVALYVGNWPTAFDGPGRIVAHTWSLSVEEQFYILWPLVLIGARRLRVRVLPVAVGLAALSLLERIVFLAHGTDWDAAMRVFYGTDTTAFALLAGCVAAAWLRDHGPVDWRRAEAPVWCGLALCPLLGVTGGTVPLIVAPVLASTLTALLLATRPGGFLTHPALRYVGRRSYALYLWHALTLAWAPSLGGGPVVTAALVGLAWAVTLLSWRYVESPWLTRRATVQQVGPVHST